MTIKVTNDQMIQLRRNHVDKYGQILLALLSNQGWLAELGIHNRNERMFDCVDLLFCEWLEKLGYEQEGPGKMPMPKKLDLS